MMFLVDGNIQDYEVLKKSTVNIFLDKFEEKAKKHEQEKLQAAHANSKRR